MDAQLKAKWVEALRSDEYLQCTGKLHEPGTRSYCCLGVLNEIANITPMRGGYSAEGYHPFYDALGRENVSLLWQMNDGGSSFSKIADYIEEHL